MLYINISKTLFFLSSENGPRKEQSCKGFLTIPLSDSELWLSLCLVLAAGGGQGMPCGSARGEPGGPGPRPALTLVSPLLMQ